MNGYEIWFFDERHDLIDISKGKKLNKDFNRMIEAENYIVFRLEDRIRKFLSVTYARRPENIEVIILKTDKLQHIYHMVASYTKIEISEQLFECWVKIYVG